MKFSEAAFEATFYTKNISPLYAWI